MKRNIVVPTLVLDAITCFLVLFLSHRPAVLLLFFLIISIALLVLQKSDWKIFSYSVIFGIVFEVLAVHAKAWIYPTPDMWGVPFWIFLMWGIMSVSIYRIGPSISKK